MRNAKCTTCGGEGVIAGGERGEVMEACPVCNPPIKRTAESRLRALLAARPHTAILDVYAHPTLTDKLIISEQLKRIELLLVEILKALKTREEVS